MNCAATYPSCLGCPCRQLKENLNDEQIGTIVKQKPEITFNTNRTYPNGKKAPDGIEVRFGVARPTIEMKKTLKSHGFRFSGKQKMWYAIDNTKSRAYLEQLEKIHPIMISNELPNSIGNTDEELKASGIIDIPEIKLSYVKPCSKKFTGKINDASTAADILRDIIGIENIPLQEFFVVLYLNRNNRVIGYYRHSKGGLSGTVVDVRLVLSVALKCLSTNIILSHNHPSGNTSPSNQDIQITKQIKSAAQFLSIEVTDHIIITVESFHSFANEGLLGIPEQQSKENQFVDENNYETHLDNDRLREFKAKALKLKDY